MPLRRLFFLGAGVVVSFAALVAIATVLSGDFGETEARIFATLATTFVAGSAVIAGVACLGRGASPIVSVGGIVLAVAGFVLWSVQIWGEYDSDGYWQLLGIVTAWTLALLVTTTNRLMVSSPRLIGTVYPATAAAALGAALAATVMLLREEGDGWQLLGVLVILALLGEALAPILERYAAAEAGPAERVLAVVAGVEVIAVRGEPQSVRVGAHTHALRRGESVVVREKQPA